MTITNLFPEDDDDDDRSAEEMLSNDDLGPQSRNSDPITSKMSDETKSEEAEKYYRTSRETLKMKLAWHFLMAGDQGLTNSEVRDLMPKVECPWKRVSEMVQQGVLYEDGSTRMGNFKTPNLIRYITPQLKKAMLRRIADGKDEMPGGGYRRNDA